MKTVFSFSVFFFLFSHFLKLIQSQRHYQHTTCAIALITLDNRRKWRLDKRGEKHQSCLEKKKKKHTKRGLFLPCLTLIRLCLRSFYCLWHWAVLVVIKISPQRHLRNLICIVTELFGILGNMQIHFLAMRR